jgi:hypothetical protein
MIIGSVIFACYYLDYINDQRTRDHDAYTKELNLEEIRIKYGKSN